MKKNEILVIFENYQRANWFIEDKILPLMPYLKKKINNIYESDTFIVMALSLSNEQNIRGRNADLIFLSYECSLKQYQTILELVKGNHSKVQVVM